MNAAEVSRRTGVVLCDCGGTLFDEDTAESIRSRLEFDQSETPVLSVPAACTTEGCKAIRAMIEKLQLDRLVVAGCSPSKNERTIRALASEGRIAEGHVVPLNIRETIFLPPDGRGIAGAENRIVAATRAIRRGVRSAAAIEDIETIEVPVEQSALVVGDGECADVALCELSRLGVPATLVTSREAVPETVSRLDAEVHTGARVSAVDGFVGSFTVSIASANGGDPHSAPTECGAIIIAPDPWHEGAGDLGAACRSESDAVVGLADLLDAWESLPRIPRTRSVAIVLDREIDETKASTELACEIALRLQRESVCQVHVLCRDVRVASLHLEALYDRARDAGVAFVKYSGNLTVSPAGEEVTVGCIDDVLGARLELRCDLVAVSAFGLRREHPERTGEAARIAALLRVDLDELGYAQGNNVHLFPVQTNVPGVFVAGAARGEHYLPQAVEDAKAAAVEAHTIVARPVMRIENSGARVDEEKCAICLTCIRVCPHRAMRIDREKGVAENLPAACRKCGICAGECPAGAITLPVYTTESVLARLG